MSIQQQGGFGRETLDASVAYIHQFLVKSVEQPGHPSFLALAETAERFNETRWFWTDDNAKASELLCEPSLFDANPADTNAAIDFVLRMSEGVVIQRRFGVPELRVLNADPQAFRVETAFFIVEGDLTKGLLRHALRFNDGRTVTAATHTGNTFGFRYGGRGFTRDVETAITGYAVEVGDQAVVLSHTSTITIPASRWRRREIVVGALRYAYTVSADRPSVALRISFELAPGIALTDINVTAALDQLSIIPGVDYRGVAIRTGTDDRAVRQVPDGKADIHAGPADYCGIVQEGASPGFSYGIHILMRDGARLQDILARGQTQGRLHWVLNRYAIGALAEGGHAEIAEERMLTGGGYYDALAHYQGVMRDAAGGGSLDPSMTYDIGAELNAIAVHILFARAGCYAHPPSAARLAALQAWYDRHLQYYFDFIRPEAPDAIDRVFTRGVAFVALSLDCMLRATGDMRYRTQLAVAVDLILRLRRRLPLGAHDAHETTFGDSWAGHTPFLDNHAACILALARAAWHGDPGGTISATISEAILGIKLHTGVVDLGNRHFETCDSLAVTNPPGPSAHADTGFWNYKLGLTLRALDAARRAAARGVIQLSPEDNARIAMRRQIGIMALTACMRRHGAPLEVLTSRISGETNSETQPWVTLGLVPIVDERIETLGL